jgi:hypothetical protein
VEKMETTRMERIAGKVAETVRGGRRVAGTEIAQPFLHGQ